MRRSIFLFSLCVVTALVAGCGNKGPLYLPKPAPAAPKKPLTAAPAHASTATAPAQLSTVGEPASATSVSAPASASSSKPASEP